MNSNCSNLLDMRNLQEQVKKAFCYQKWFWPLTVRRNCSSDLKIFSRSLEQFFLTVSQNNFGNKIPFFPNNSKIEAHTKSVSFTQQIGVKSISFGFYISIFVLAKRKRIQRNAKHYWTHTFITWWPHWLYRFLDVKKTSRF